MKTILLLSTLLVIVISCGKYQMAPTTLENAGDRSFHKQISDLPDPSPTAIPTPTPTSNPNPSPTSVPNPGLCTSAPFPIPTGCTQDAECPNFADCTGHCTLYHCVWTHN